MTEITIVPVERLELACRRGRGRSRTERRDEIAAHFDALQRANPALWNGRVLMLHRHAIKAPVFPRRVFRDRFRQYAGVAPVGFAGPMRKELFCHGCVAR